MRIKVLWGLFVLTVLLAMATACAQPSPKAAAGEERITGKLQLEGGQTFQYSLSMPANWRGKYSVREEGNIAYFDYAADPSQKYPLFLIAAHTKAQWQELLKEPGYHGEEILSRDGFVFTYSIALDNPYSGQHAETFQKMAGQVRDIASSLQVTLK